MTDQSKSLAVQEPSVALMLQGALANIQSGQITEQHVGVLKGMMELYERNEARQSQRDFAVALTALQGETIRVQATKAVDVKDGKPRYTFAPYEDIMKAVQPMLTRHGFSVTFDTEAGTDRLTSILTLTHASGHFRTNRFAVRYGKPPGSSDAQGDMSTKNYAKRGALCDALNISIGHDDDARSIGDYVTPEQADELRRRAKACGANEANLLIYLDKAVDYEHVPAARYSDAIAQIEKKEAKAAAHPTGERDEHGNFKF